jgi:cytochrome c oxidase subunit 2
MSMLRLRQAAPVLFLVAGLLALQACGGTEYPNSTFNHTSDLNTSIDALWDRLLFWGTIVFVFVEAGLIFTIIKFRKRPGGPPAKQIHGNAALEITWTVIPALILLLIAIPTVKTIFQTQAPAPAGALTVEVIGHQWWWEIRYPEYNIVTANEIYIPTGRPANFVLTTVDVIHSFWIPQLGGKRDLVTNRTNYLWFTPNADLGTQAFNGFCTEYCGTSHANMRIRMFTVSPEEFESWARHQATIAQPRQADSARTTPGYVFPKEALPAHVVPQTPVPTSVAFDDALLATGNPVRGATQWMISCMACHTINGVPNSTSLLGPDLTHVASRHTIAGGLFPNEPHILARWIKNPRALKPGALMNANGLGVYDAYREITVGPQHLGLTDSQIADVVAYLATLK